MSMQLFVVAGPDKDRVFALQSGASLMLGRGVNSLYHLSDPRVSRAHCQVLLEGNQVTVIDNQSVDGVLVLDRPKYRRCGPSCSQDRGNRSWHCP